MRTITKHIRTANATKRMH